MLLLITSVILRWQPAPDASDHEALISLWRIVSRGSTLVSWEVERAVLEIFCEHGASGSVAWLTTVYHFSGRHGNDRRRLALQALSGIAAQSGEASALQTMEAALAHRHADTRGWAIGFLIGSYAALGQPLPPSAAARLRCLMEQDRNPSVRVEAATALLEAGLIDPASVHAVIVAAEACAQAKGAQRRRGAAHE